MVEPGFGDIYRTARPHCLPEQRVTAVLLNCCGTHASVCPKEIENVSLGDKVNLLNTR